MNSRKFNNFYGDYEVGEGTRFGEYCDIGGKIGKRCIIQSFAFIPPRVTIEDNVFIGPRVTFTNDKHPPSNDWSDILVKMGESIGAGATILPGIIIGAAAVIGAGAVVTKDVPRGETFVGNPARNINEI